jgi:hypothetical protein
MKTFWLFIQFARIGWNGYARRVLGTRRYLEKTWELAREWIKEDMC